MVWQQCDIMDERLRFIAAWMKQEEPVTVLCCRFGVSRKTAYKWIWRYRQNGPNGLQDRSSARRTQQLRTALPIAEAVIALRCKYPTWGPRKLRARLMLDAPDMVWPAASTIGDLLQREGLVRPRKLRHRVAPMEHPFAETLAANDVWCMDFKGHWRTGDGTRFEPFTMTDAWSRYLLVCKPVDRPNYCNVWPMIASALRKHGLPSAIRSDNGPPFASIAAGGLSKLGVNLIKAGITLQRIEPGKPQQNGRHERMHLSLKQEVAIPPSKTARAQAVRLHRFVQMFNYERPHEALNQIPPASVYTSSPRVWDGKLRSPDYWNANHIRKVHTSGCIRFKGSEVFVSQVLNGEPVGMFEVNDDEYQLRFGPVLLGTLNRKMRLQRCKPKRKKTKKVSPICPV